MIFFTKITVGAHYELFLLQQFNILMINYKPPPLGNSWSFDVIFFLFFIEIYGV